MTIENIQIINPDSRLVPIEANSSPGRPWDRHMRIYPKPQIPVRPASLNPTETNPIQRIIEFVRR